MSYYVVHPVTKNPMYNPIVIRRRSFLKPVNRQEWTINNIRTKKFWIYDIPSPGQFPKSVFEKYLAKLNIHRNNSTFYL